MVVAICPTNICILCGSNLTNNDCDKIVSYPVNQAITTNARGPTIMEDQETNRDVTIKFRCLKIS